jgi:SAM-dependent methyltransferase
MGPSTGHLLNEVGLVPGMSCLDVGCGGGDVAREMARRVGASGAVVAVDGDPSILALDRAEAEDSSSARVRYVQADASALRLGAGFDLVYARFLLTHVGDPAGVLGQMVQAAREGGRVAAEDIEFSGHVCYPACRAFARYIELYREVVRLRGGDPDIGPRLPSLFLAAGVESVTVRVAQPVALEGEAKEIAPLTLAAIADAVLAEGLASDGEVDGLVAELSEFAADPRTLLSLPRVFQVWGRRRA